MHHIKGPIPEEVLVEVLERIRREVIARGWVQEERGDELVEIVRGLVEEQYGRDQRSPNA